MLQSSPNWQLCLFDQDGQALVHDDTEENIDPNSTRANDEVNKFKDPRFYRHSKVEKNSVQDQVRLENFLKVPCQRKRGEKLRQYLLRNLTLTLPTSS